MSKEHPAGRAGDGGVAALEDFTSNAPCQLGFPWLNPEQGTGAAAADLWCFNYKIDN